MAKVGESEKHNLLFSLDLNGGGGVHEILFATI